MSQGQQPKFEASLVLRAKNQEDALLLWRSVYPNLGVNDLSSRRVEAKLDANRIEVTLVAESASKLRARLSSLMLWTSVVYSVLETSRGAKLRIR